MLTVPVRRGGDGRLGVQRGAVRTSCPGMAWSGPCDCTRSRCGFAHRLLRTPNRARASTRVSRLLGFNGTRPWAPFRKLPQVLPGQRPVMTKQIKEQIGSLDSNTAVDFVTRRQGRKISLRMPGEASAPGLRSQIEAVTLQGARGAGSPCRPSPKGGEGCGGSSACKFLLCCLLAPRTCPRAELDVGASCPGGARLPPGCPPAPWLLERMGPLHVSEVTGLSDIKSLTYEVGELTALVGKLSLQGKGQRDKPGAARLSGRCGRSQ